MPDRRGPAEQQPSVPAMAAPPPARDNPLTRSLSGMIGLGFLTGMILTCLLSLPWTLGEVSEGEASIPRYNAGDTRANRLPPLWWPANEAQRLRLNGLVDAGTASGVAELHGLTAGELVEMTSGPAYDDLAEHHPGWLLGTDKLGRSVLVRALAGGGISLGVGIAAALISVVIGTLYGALAAYAGGAVDAAMMRVVDVLYGLPYILLVVLLAVAADAVAERLEGGSGGWAVNRTTINVVTLLVAIGGVSWLTMARVIRGQVLSLKRQPFVEAARAMGVGPVRVFWRHLLPNLLGPVIVYATLTAPQAILQESFLSFLGIGIQPPLPSWGNLAADGLGELNTYASHWWLLAAPCALLAATLLALNFVGEGLREAFDPKRARR